MSIKIMSQIWENSRQSGSTLLLLLALADHADDDGYCFPGVVRLAKKTRKSPRAVQQSIAELVKAGELVVNYNQGIDTQSGKTNLYQIVIPEGVKEIAPLNKGVKKVAPQGVKKSSPEGVKEIAPKSSVETSDKPPVDDLPKFLSHFKSQGHAFTRQQTQNAIVAATSKHGLDATLAAYERAIENGAENVGVYAAGILRNGGVKQNGAAAQVPNMTPEQRAVYNTLMGASNGIREDGTRKEITQWDGDNVLAARVAALTVQ